MPTSTHDRTILVVDDDEDICSLVAAILEDEGYAVRTAANGAEALKNLRTLGKPDLILLDMKMPVMDGWEFARRLRTECADDVPVVVFSAAENPALRASEVHAKGWIGKPLELDALLDAVSRNVRSSAHAVAPD
ncbi:MAG: response regulator [Deltaproteobacteria bacterium]|nr:response regulator [Deltaproteobacteria bacterium]